MSSRNTSQGRRAGVVRLAVLALVVAGAAAAVGVAAAPGSASPAAAFPVPKIRNGLLAITGTAGDDKIALRLKAGDPKTLEVDVNDDGTADFSFPRAAIAQIDVFARAGNDLVRVDESNGAFTTTIPTTLDGGAGDDELLGGAGAVTLQGGPGRDKLLGGNGAELLLGGSGDDIINGNKGNDVAFMGPGDDSFGWAPGDGSDTIEGDQGNDAMVFIGAAAAEKVDLSANGNHLRFTRDVASITMDTHGVERVDFDALGGADQVTVNDLAATDVRSVNVDLAGTLGGGVFGGGDGAADRVILKGTARADAIDVSGDSSAVKVSGLAATVSVLSPEVAKDRLDLNEIAANDTVNSAGLSAGAIQLFVDGVLVP
jgi:Ca2+-binding RTX toxin-like protein